MNYKRITGIVILIIGVILIILSVHFMHEIAAAKGEIHSLTSPFSSNAVGKSFGGMLQNKAGQYDTTVMTLLISGIILAVVGGFVGFFGKKKRR